MYARLSGGLHDVLLYREVCATQSQLQKQARTLKFKMFSDYKLSERRKKALIRLLRCTGWSVPLLFARTKSDFLAPRPIYNNNNNYSSTEIKLILINLQGT